MRRRSRRKNFKKVGGKVVKRSTFTTRNLCPCPFLYFYVGEQVKLGK
jgi:hypothetical protein